VLIGAADHGVADDGVSAYPAVVTTQMAGAFLGGIGAINAFSRAVRAEVYVADFGMRTPLPAHPRLIDVRCGPGTASMAHGPAIPAERLGEVLRAGETAFEMVYERAPFDVVAFGDMGIANTTAAAAIVAAFTGSQASDVVGRGTGIDDARLLRKTEIVEAVVRRIGTPAWQRVASEAGGYEIVGLAGAMLAAARRRIPIVLDGYIVTAAALIAHAIAPSIAEYYIAAHRSREPGHLRALAALGLRPLLDLDLALGEASGAVLAFPLIEAAARMVREMKTFAEAGVASEEPVT
jgi:nicotinate-nucleotide--dimethylbenzimidazole phosphoribosyltransferase